MSRAVSTSRIVDACLDGIRQSFEEYEEWSGGCWLGKAPEYLLTVNIAKELAMIDGSKYITLEDNVKKTLKNANANLKGRQSGYMRQNGRADIVVWWGNYIPRGIIEVKHRVYKFNSFSADIDRIIEILKKESDIQFGISTFYISNYYSGNAEEKMDNRIKTLYEQTKDYLNEFAPQLKIKLEYDIFPDEDDCNVWASVAILMMR
ncbi:hypothetical protein [Nitratifractor salsuginis]|uniref:AntA/AntB antirepressor domain protein n=1 Tax=Nitratifractor salsuginis (strain DSM 16511 / JCM 12458 / E9I37-1) TaxID=749222 RepID=E6X338_NITSE|nr:hypothetical protein [Nitratifractor salsuginis]ADV46182.1 AntA/AntB antirepressor domain protein [Nitratifractor salsuginis DSM 16511]